MLPLVDAQVRLVLLNHVAVRLAEAQPSDLQAVGIENEQLARLRQLSALDLSRLAAMRDLTIGIAFDAVGLNAGLRAVALVFGTSTLTYEQLNADANRLARLLIREGVRPGGRTRLRVQTPSSPAPGARYRACEGGSPTQSPHAAPVRPARGPVR